MQYVVRSVVEMLFLSFGLTLAQKGEAVEMRGSSVRRGLTALVAVLGFGCASCSFAMGAKPDVNIESIRAAWMKRQQGVRSARFEWQGTVAEQLPDYSVQEQEMHPELAEFHSLEQRWSLVFDGQLMRFSSHGKKWVGRRTGGGFADRPYTSVLGRENIWQDFGENDPTEAVRSTPTGDIYRVSDWGGSIEKQNYHVSPIVLHYRALNPLVSPIEGVLTLSDRIGVVNGQRCLIVNEKGSRNREYWVDPQRGFAIMRCKESAPKQPAKPWVQFDVAYEETPDHSYVLSGWKGSLVYVESGQLREAWDCKMTSYVLNGPVDPTEFEYEFPPNTWVKDHRNENELHYIARGDGKKRAILQAELLSGATYEEFLRTESGMAIGTSAEQSFGRSTWAICATGAIVVVLLVVLVRRKLNLEA